MHIADLDRYIIGATGIVGSGAPIAGGAALAAKLQKTGQAVACFFGDGAINQGVVFEALNMAAIWKLPVIFVCENNLYALSTPADKMTALKQLADRGQGFGIPGVHVSGNDLRAVVRETRAALARFQYKTTGAISSLRVLKRVREEQYRERDRGVLLAVARP